MEIFMKQLKSIATLLALLTLTSAASANSLFLKKNHSMKDEPALVTLNVIANPPYTASVSEEVFAGTSTAAPCTDLHSLGKVGPQDIDIVSETDTLSSSDVSYAFGKELSCIKFDFTMNKTGHVYSTGNLQLHWNAATSSYDSAMPDTVTLDVSNQ
jgi:hypothetical protein